MKTAREVDKALETAGNIAAKYGHVYISTEHMLLGMFKNTDFAKMLISFGIQLNELQLDLESHVADALTNKGYKFKIDDFGTGYGGFSYLQDLGIRCVKVDKMFIDPIGSDDQKLKVLDSIVSAANKAECEMIAEGVESQAQVEYLAQHAIYLIQGYVYAKPEPLTNLAGA